MDITILLLMKKNPISFLRNLKKEWKLPIGKEKLPSISIKNGFSVSLFHDNNNFDEVY